MVIPMLILLLVERSKLDMSWRQVGSFGVLILSIANFRIGFGEIEKAVWLYAVFGVWIGYRLVNRQSAKMGLLVLLTGLIIIGCLVLNGIVDNKFKLDLKRFYFVDGGYTKLIADVQKDATYVPFRLRPMVFNSWIIGVDSIGRGVGMIWLDRAVGVYGLLFSILLGIGILKQRMYVVLGVVFIAAITTGLSRNPDSTGLFLLVAPLLVSAGLVGWQNLTAKI